MQHGKKKEMTPKKGKGAPVAAKKTSSMASKSKGSMGSKKKGMC